MEPPLKRPRLSIFESSVSGEELENARLQNDMLLKSRWEAIFDKYSRDFSDIGDEVDVMTGEIVVNRGHLEGMETETDPGQFDSKTFLRIISAAQENGDPYPYSGIDGVLPSIETMAEQAVDRLSPSDCEQGVTRQSPAISTDSQSSSDVLMEGFDDSLEPYESDRDSLFAEDDQGRESSVDSLFDAANNASTPEVMRDKSSSSEVEMADDHHIMAKFGPDLGQEVLNLLEQRQQAHIEPAWRIPVTIEPAKVNRSVPKPVEPSTQSISPPRDSTRSIWAIQPEQRPPSSSPQLPSSRNRARYESEDPLHEGFVEKQIHVEEMYSSDGYVYGSKDTEQEEAEEAIDPATVTNLIEASKSGDCTFCHRHFRDKSGVMAHWDRLLKKVDKLGDEDPHDANAIREVRSRVTRRVRLRRLTVGDFKAMVEFHEGAGLSFDEIAESKILRTRKTGPQLQDIYDRHRTPHQLRETPEPQRNWPAEEDKAVLEMSENPLATIATLRRGMKGRSELQIGNRLAELWLKDLGDPNVVARETHRVQNIKQEPVDDLFD